MAKVVKVKIDAIATDPRLIELRSINAHTVSRYSQAMQHGAKFPPIIVDKKTKLVVDGNQRFEAHKRAFDSKTKIEVIWRDFQDMAEILRCVVQENIAHGYPMDTWTKKKIVCAMIDEGIATSEMAEMFQMKEQKVIEFGGHRLVVVGEDGTQRRLPPKRGVEVKDGTKVTQKQWTEHEKKDRGVTARQSALQLIRFIRNEWIDFTLEANREVLLELRNAIDNAL